MNRMGTIHMVLACVVVLLGAVSVQSSSILAQLEKEPSTSSLAAAIKLYPDLKTAASNANTQVTLFAPSNAAFATVLAALGLKELPKAGTAAYTLVGNVLAYHVVPRVLLARQLRHAATYSTLLSPAAVLIADLKAGPLVAIRGQNSVGKVTKANIHAGKAVIHLIDAVLLPVNPFPVAAPSVAAAATSTPALSTLVAALTRANLVGAFGPDFNGTVYAPTNEAFAALLKALKLPNLEAVPLDVLTKVLKYHVTPSYRPASLHVGNTRARTLAGQTLFFFYDRKSGAGPFIRDSNPKSLVKITTANVYAGKGVVHVIDKVLLPK